jgi:thiosulfate dehydrogenase
MLRFGSLAFVLALLAACGHAAGPAASAAYDATGLPSGALGADIRYGREIVMHTRRLLPQDVRANMDCAACHISGGTKPHGGSFIGTYVKFPQWNKRARRVVMLQDRVAECFLYSENGKSPAFWSRQMIAVVSYIAWLSRNTPVLSTVSGQSFVTSLPSSPPSAVHGAALFAARCALCHGAGGAGSNVIPPLWGNASFNKGAGMARIQLMTGFVYFNMPQNAPGTLSLQDAYDISAFVLSHERPAFRSGTLVSWPAEPARYF